MPPLVHVLDNPIWNGLISGNKDFAQGTDSVRFFPAAIAPFIGLQENTEAHFDTLHDIVPSDRTFVHFGIEKPTIPDSWNVIVQLPGFQLTYTGADVPVLNDEEIVSLTNEHIPQMLSLTTLTNPGPFSSRTIDFGNYEGIFRDGLLVAMAGQRLHPYEYVEISAVCTHPDYAGKGFARQLLLRQVQQIIVSGGIPFLHVRSDNSRAVNLYKRLGFEIRTDVYFTVIQKKNG